MHLKSDYMRRLRLERMRWKGSFCERCGDGSRYLQTHHVTYQNVPHERVEDIRLLCRQCHLGLHKFDSWRHFWRWVKSVLLGRGL